MEMDLGRRWQGVETVAVLDIKFASTNLVDDELDVILTRQRCTDVRQMVRR